MTKAIKFYNSVEGMLSSLSDLYILWLEQNPKVKVISTVFDKDTLLVTYEEIPGKIDKDLPSKEEIAEEQKIQPYPISFSWFLIFLFILYVFVFGYPEGSWIPWGGILSYL